MTETTPHHAPQASPNTPPVAPKRYGYRVRDQFGQHFDDPWDWLRDGEDPEVRAHLEAENAWADTVTAPTEQPGQELIKMLGRGVYFVQRRDFAGFTPPPLTT